MDGVGKCIFLKHENKVNTSGITSNFGPPAGSEPEASFGGLGATGWGAVAPLKEKEKKKKRKKKKKKEKKREKKVKKERREL